MCLAKPMRIDRIIDGRRAVVSEGKVEVEVDISLLEHANPGDYVIVHAGYAIEMLSLQEAEERLALFRQLADLTGEPGAS
jgi:hydrogenase expression/formation protein HypC